jgi:ribosome-binding factor A
MKTNTRLIRINDEIMRETAQIIRAELKDPRIGVMTSVVKTETTNDLSYTKVYVSVMGDEAQQKDVMTGLKNAAGFIRKQIAQRINLRVTPVFQFILDDSMAYSAKINQLINEVNRLPKAEDSEKEEKTGDE